MTAYHVETWKGIANSIGRSERWCRYMAQRPSDPLPVSKVGGIVRLNLQDLHDWLGNQRTRTLARPVMEALGDFHQKESVCRRCTIRHPQSDE